MKVVVPSQLRDYTDGASLVEARGASLAALLSDLDLRYPGIRFRMVDEQESIRRHLKIFVNREQVRRLDAPLTERDEIVIVGALSGG
jgi:molybdopterin converting factor small subunit